ncbi:hypothetical protein Tco_1314926 [Tanacetum coccineum]
MSLTIKTQAFSKAVLMNKRDPLEEGDGIIVAGDGITGIKRRRRDLSSDGVRNMAMASGRGRLKEDLESSMCR